MSTTSIPPSARTRAYVSWILRHGRAVWIVALVVGVFTLWRTARLYAGLRSEIELLLPQSAPSVLAVEELRRRMPGIQYLGILVDAGSAKDLPAAERFATDLAGRIATYPRSMVAAVRLDVSAEKKFLKRHAPLYVEIADLKEIRRRVEARLAYEEEKAVGADLDEDRKAPSIDVGDIEARYRAKDGNAARYPNDRFTSRELAATVILVEIAGYSTGSDRAQVLLDRIRRDAKALGFPQKYAAGLRYAFSGDPAIRVEELSALVTDLTFSTLVIVGLVILVLATYYRWWRAVPAILVPLLLSTSYSFTLASLPPFSIGALNSNTAFLGSIIIGNGINFGIILVARYVEERRRGLSSEEALVWAVHATRVGTITAAAAAGIAYGSLVVTQFRGFWQFGVIGGLGMLLCWGVTFLLIPPFLAWLDRKPAAAPQPLRRAAGGITGVLATAVSRQPGIVLALGVIVTVGAVVGSRSFGDERLETNFSKLRRRDTWTSGEGYWGRKVDKVLGRYLTPMVVLADTPEQSRAIAADLREAVKRPPLSGIIGSVQTADGVLPRDQERKIAEVEAIRKILEKPRVREALPEERRQQVDELLGQGPQRPITAGDLPPTFLTALRERSGVIDRAVLIYPRDAKQTWKGQKLLAMTKELRRVLERHPGPDGQPPRIAGPLLISSDIITSMRRDGPLATGVAIAGVILLVLVVFRGRRESFLVFGALLVGVLWMVWGTILFDIKLNFANFIGFPITFGIGVDYAVNVAWRYRLDGGRDVVGAIRSTGGAVGLCSLTTVIGYSSLLMAQNQALFSFGLMAVIGEITCLVTAVLLLPAVLLLLDRRRSAAPAPASDVVVGS